MVHWWIFRRRLSNRHGRPRRMLIWTFEGNTDRTVSTLYVIRTSRVLSPDRTWPDCWLSEMHERRGCWPGYDSIVHWKKVSRLRPWKRHAVKNPGKVWLRTRLVRIRTEDQTCVNHVERAHSPIGVSFECPHQHPPWSPVSIGKPAPKIHQWTIYFCRWGFGWVDKAQCFRSARRFGAARFEPGLFQGFSRHDASWSWNFLSMYCYTAR